MQANKTVTINGRLYDAVTGLPVAAPKASSPSVRKAVAAPAVHASTQRSKTLHRRATKKTGVVAKRPQPGTHMDIARSSTVKKFAAHPVATQSPKRPVVMNDIAPKTHPVAQRAHHKQAVATHPVAAAPKTAKDVKEQAIAAALAAPTKKVEKKPTKKRFSWSRRTTIIVSIVVFIFTAGVITYVALPGVSVAIASAQAGVDASYPSYVPDGYSLAQPVTFSDGEVVLKFTSNSSAGSYSIAQLNSSWDSSAVLENVVKKAVGDNYVINQERGLTIYAYDGDAAWVNGGILYTITSSAPLSGDQIRRIATSL
jgi:hypothetical protein